MTITTVWSELQITSEYDSSRVKGFGYFGPRNKASHWTASLLSKGLEGDITQRGEYLVGTFTALSPCHHFLNIHISRCLHTKTLCKVKEASYSQNKKNTIFHITSTTHWSGRQNTGD
jgi:hypothetical protein